MARSRHPSHAALNRATVRFSWYCEATGASTPALTPGWRRPPKQVLELIRAGARAANRLRRVAKERGDAREPLAELEDVLTRLARADDWTRRLKEPLKKLPDKDAHRALEKLVKLGCVPDALIAHLSRLWELAPALAKQKTEIAAYHRALLRTAKALEATSDPLDQVLRSAHNPHIQAPFEWTFSRELSLMGERCRARHFARALDWRNPSFVDSRLFALMKQIKAMTGSYQDSAVFDLLHETIQAKGSGPDALRKWRIRFAQQHSDGVRVQAKGDQLRR